MYNVGLIRLKSFHSKVGSLAVAEGNQDIPFEIKRVYYIYGVPSEERRGFHAHRNLHQVLICLNGSVQVQIQNASRTQKVTLSDPATGLYIGPRVWREMYDFSPGCVLMALASERYDESDYIRSYEEYLSEVQNFF